MKNDHSIMSKAIAPFFTSDSSYMSTLANSEDPDEMPHVVAFHLGLHCLLRQKKSEKGKQLYLECDFYTNMHWAIPSSLYQTRRKMPLVQREERCWFKTNMYVVLNEKHE